jgi:hypothetical protein
MFAMRQSASNDFSGTTLRSQRTITSLKNKVNTAIDDWKKALK